MRFDDLLDGAAGVERLWHVGDRSGWLRDVRFAEAQRRGCGVFVCVADVGVDMHVVHQVRALQRVNT
jgi:hypothetical protein